MSSEHLVGTSIPRFTFDTPTTPGNDFYALCAGTEPLCMIFLPGFDHPVTREYLTRYLKTLPRLRVCGWPAWCAQPPAQRPRLHRGKSFPSPSSAMRRGCCTAIWGWSRPADFLSWSFSAQRIYKSARDAGYHYDRNAPQILPMTLIVGHEGKILFTHSGRSQTDLPEDCIAIRELAREVVHTKAADQRRASHHCSDETLTLPDLIGWDDVDNDQ